MGIWGDRRTVMIVIAAALVLSACGGANESAISIHSEVAASTPAPSAEPPDAEANEVLAFTASTIDGDQFEGAGLIGRDVAIWFWAPW